MKPARKLRPSGIRRRHGAMDDTTIQQEAEQRRPGRGQERRRASPPSRGRRSIDRTAAKATSGEGEGKGWERPGGATECREAPRGRRRRTEQRPVPASQARGGRTRPPPPSKSANVGPLRTRGLILFAGIHRMSVQAGPRSERGSNACSATPAQALRHDSLPGESA